MKPQSIPLADLHALVTEGKEITLIDVRDPLNYNLGHVPGARNIPFATLAPHLENLDPKKPVYFICQVGEIRSVTAAEQAHAAGIPQAFFIAGGTTAWREAKLSLEFNLPLKPAPTPPRILATEQDPARFSGFDGHRILSLPNQRDTASQETAISLSH